MARTTPDTARRATSGPQQSSDPRLLPSTIDPAFDLTLMNAANSPYTLGVMTVITVVSLPIILAYQAWSYWIFRQRVTPGMIPDAHIVLPAILRDTDAATRG